MWAVRVQRYREAHKRVSYAEAVRQTVKCVEAGKMRGKPCRLLRRFLGLEGLILLYTIAIFSPEIEGT